MKKLILIVFLLSIFSCNKKKSSNELPQSEKVNVKDDSVKQTVDLIEIYKDSLKQVALDKKDFTIIEKNKAADHPSSMKDKSVCKEWELSNENIKTIFANSVPITGPEWHYVFDVLPCVYIGKFKYKNIIYEYQINGGSWLDIGNKKKAIRLGYYKENGDDLFLVLPWIPEKEENNK